jgi:hypothetical protein
VAAVLGSSGLLTNDASDASDCSASPNRDTNPNRANPIASTRFGRPSLLTQRQSVRRRDQGSWRSRARQLPARPPHRLLQERICAWTPPSGKGCPARPNTLVSADRRDSLKSLPEQVLKPVFSVEEYGAAVDLGRDHLKLGQIQLWAVSLNDVT